jgi:anaerobic ribonucleoside-triphosphate reductase activating protein
MNLAGIMFPVHNPYDGVAYEIYVSGCLNGCKGCHNPEMQSFKYGNYLDIAKLIKDIQEQEQWIDIISILGGDLLSQPKYEAMLLMVALKSHFKDKKFWLFTGSTEEELPLWIKEVFDVIKVGRYNEKLRQEGFPASSNQKLLKKGKDYGTCK